jgi:uncharacterized protein
LTPPDGPGRGRDQAGRDRDQAGRARNARPRDSAGRPLPRDAAGEPRVPDDLVLAPADALAMAQGLLDGERPFQAHEVLEASWKAAPGPERDLWQGLAQLAVGLTHAQRGNVRGAAALLRRGAERLASYHATEPDAAGSGAAGSDRLHGVDVRGLAATAQALADRIEQAGLDNLTPADLRLRLQSRSDHISNVNHTSTESEANGSS